MAHDLQIKVEHGHLVPVMAESQEVLDGLEGECFRAVLTQTKGRSYPQLKLYFGMIKLLIENWEGEQTLSKNALDQFIRIETGHCDVVKFADGTYRFFSRSIAFDQMSPEAFSAFLDKAFDVVAIKFGPHLAEAVRGELYKLME
jgi:hypothetical protein